MSFEVWLFAHEKTEHIIQAQLLQLKSTIRIVLIESIVSRRHITHFIPHQHRDINQLFNKDEHHSKDNNNIQM